MTTITTIQSSELRKSFWRALALTLLVATLNFALWGWLSRPTPIAGWSGPIGGLAFTAFQRYGDPTKSIFPNEDDLAEDVRLMSTVTNRLRTYSALENPQVPRLARLHGMDVMQGVYLDRRFDRNERELDALEALAGKYDNITRAIVGNETLLRADMSVEQLVGYIDRARAHLNIPVSTAEPMFVWLRYPVLAQHVDFITIHLLPYWEKIPRKDAINFVIGQYNEMKRLYPDKPIVIGEVGWPSNGDRKDYAFPTVADQAQFLREWFNVAAGNKIDYYVMEAIDQPWKAAHEGPAGAYWGMFNANREAKFSLTGAVVSDPTWPIKAIAAVLLALLPMYWFARHFIRFRITGLLFFLMMMQLSSSVLIWSATLPYDFYLKPFDWLMLTLLLPAQIAIILVLLINGFEFTEVIWNRRWLRHAGLLTPKPGDPQPFVSVHLACYNEPPEMVRLTLDSLAALDYENFEVLVIDNNTKDEAVWKPVQEYCEQLGPRFRFFHLAPWPGFKAGALNYGLEQTDPRAEVIAVVDADYEVRSDWLRALTGYFANDKVAVVQCPQAHRDWEHNAFRRMANWEYDGFFRIGMHHRNERNAIIQHGTMTMVRRDVLETTGKWSEWTICEDAELGLRLMHAGYELIYVDELMGKGLTPADFTAYKSQRFRWAFGAMQIMKARLGWMTFERARADSRSSIATMNETGLIVGNSPVATKMSSTLASSNVDPRDGRRVAGGLTRGQKFHFLTGWFSWFADALHLVFTLMSIGWTIGMIGWPQYFTLPLRLFLVPIIGFFLSKAIFGIVLYRVRVPCSWKDTIMASIASMALSHAIARGIFTGLWKKKGEFVVTAKSRRVGRKPNPLACVREETLMLVALVLSIIGMSNAIGVQYMEGKLWIAILSAQTIPYLSAMIAAWVAARSGDSASPAAPATT